MATLVLLSICIPTHHGRGAKLERLLGQLEPQLAADDRVELCVSDNASQDATEAVVARFAERLGPERVRYRRHAENRGFTVNLLAAADLAQGRWCWFLGSDDGVTPTAVAEVAALVERHPQAAGGTLNRSISFDEEGARVDHDPAALLPDDPHREQELLSEDAIVQATGQLHDFISTQVVDRELWQAVVREIGEAQVAARGLAYPHLLVIGEMARRRPRWFWYPGDTVRQHVGTSAVFAVETDYDPAEYEARILRDRRLVWADLHAGHRARYRAPLVRTWRRHFEPLSLLRIKLSPRTAPDSELRLLREAVRAFWWLPSFWARSAPVLIVPAVLWRALQRTAQAGRALRGRPGGT